eukprot:CAMPEP_0204917574 /NCGR_PEP_ID=MMETSP1397-20131031/15174_1 /ASSEMBLY_ACC=CAM_ASM_000891 /TAXON_ID=49980 /ORGANISM="Climacostomum Climacostomum virens, Strain Stock W-24" /LENGTH=250 /DNA_ID=CAMNT_0052090449 /DNA_START=90 /DNA_END=839 /DNA_ORIENTATION=-
MDFTQRTKFYADNFIAVEQLSKQMPLSRDDKNFIYSRINQYSPGQGIPGIMLYALESFAGSNQQQWIIDTKLLKMGTALCISELGCGTEVSKLKTTAHYDVNSDEIILNSPSLDAIKWWIGAGECTTHLMLLAQLHIGGKNEGVVPILVQIRDVKTLEFLPGIVTGNVGPMPGMELQPYYYFIFSNYRVPASSLLQRFVHIQDGQLKLLHPDAKSLIMSTFVKVRTVLIGWSWRPAAMALTIAVRYSDFR